MKRNEDSEHKIGDGHAEAMFRLGLRELRGSLYPESNVAQQGEYGLYGTRTPGEVAESRRSEGLDIEEEKGSIVADRVKQAEASPSPQHETKDMEQER